MGTNYNHYRLKELFLLTTYMCSVYLQISLKKLNKSFCRGNGCIFEPDEDKKNLIRAKNRKEDFPYYFERLNAVVGKNNGYLALGRVCFYKI